MPCVGYSYPSPRLSINLPRSRQTDQDAPLHPEKEHSRSQSPSTSARPPTPKKKLPSRTSMDMPLMRSGDVIPTPMAPSQQLMMGRRNSRQSRIQLLQRSYSPKTEAKLRSTSPGRNEALDSSSSSLDGMNESEGHHVQSESRLADTSSLNMSIGESPDPEFQCVLDTHSQLGHDSINLGRETSISIESDQLKIQVFELEQRLAKCQESMEITNRGLAQREQQLEQQMHILAQERVANERLTARVKELEAARTKQDNDDAIKIVTQLRDAQVANADLRARGELDVMRDKYESSKSELQEIRQQLLESRSDCLELKVALAHQSEELCDSHAEVVDLKAALKRLVKDLEDEKFKNAKLESKLSCKEDESLIDDDHEIIPKSLLRSLQQRLAAAQQSAMSSSAMLEENEEFIRKLKQELSTQCSAQTSQEDSKDAALKLFHDELSARFDLAADFQTSIELLYGTFVESALSLQATDWYSAESLCNSFYSLCFSVVNSRDVGLMPPMAEVYERFLKSACEARVMSALHLISREDVRDQENKDRIDLYVDFMHGKTVLTMRRLKIFASELIRL